MSVSAHVEASDTVPTLQRVPIETPRVVVASRARDNFVTLRTCSVLSLVEGVVASARPSNAAREMCALRCACASPHCIRACSRVASRDAKRLFYIRRRAASPCMHVTFVTSRAHRSPDERERAGVTRRGERGCFTRGTPSGAFDTFTHCPYRCARCPAGIPPLVARCRSVAVRDSLAATLPDLISRCAQLERVRFTVATTPI